jgi:hypothetical protein
MPAGASRFRRVNGPVSAGTNEESWDVFARSNPAAADTRWDPACSDQKLAVGGGKLKHTNAKCLNHK